MSHNVNIEKQKVVNMALKVAQDLQVKRSNNYLRSYSSHYQQRLEIVIPTGDGGPVGAIVIVPRMKRELFTEYEDWMTATLGALIGKVYTVDQINELPEFDVRPVASDYLLSRLKFDNISVNVTDGNDSFQLDAHTSIDSCHLLALSTEKELEESLESVEIIIANRGSRQFIVAMYESEGERAWIRSE